MFLCQLALFVNPGSCQLSPLSCLAKEVFHLCRGGKCCFWIYCVLPSWVLVDPVLAPLTIYFIWLLYEEDLELHQYTFKLFPYRNLKSRFGRKRKNWVFLNMFMPWCSYFSRISSVFGLITTGDWNAHASRACARIWITLIWTYLLFFISPLSSLYGIVFDVVNAITVPVAAGFTTSPAGVEAVYFIRIGPTESFPLFGLLPLPVGHVFGSSPLRNHQRLLRGKGKNAKHRHC